MGQRTLPSRTNQADSLEACCSTSLMLMRRKPDFLTTGAVSCRAHRNVAPLSPLHNIHSQQQLSTMMTSFAQSCRFSEARHGLLAATFLPLFLENLLPHGHEALDSHGWKHRCCSEHSDDSPQVRGVLTRLRGSSSRQQQRRQGLGARSAAPGGRWSRRGAP